ncbi:hypothetical protein RJT34_00528 [Clitoria ternatea]|uniref:Uncharacterized protein n=1 Tax=Clitoria ternatea TaxID=43366 RepID=A0AAN9Q2S1_CLITE
MSVMYEEYSCRNSPISYLCTYITVIIPFGFSLLYTVMKVSYYKFMPLFFTSLYGSIRLSLFGFSSL